MNRQLYLECNSGISGDMTVAALLDLGADEQVLRRALASLPVDGFEIAVTRKVKSGLDVCDFDVILDAEHENHDHDMEYLHGHEDGGVHTHEHHHHDHSHEHHHDHEHGHHHDHGHHHEHRGLHEILHIIEHADMTARAKETAVRIFQILAEAESKAHGVPADQVHFHEVGAVDSIVDILAVAVCLDNLDITEVIVPFLCEGQGSIRCQHGIIPVPVPAVVNIAQAHGLTLKPTGVQGELVTPTGAAIISEIAQSFGTMPTMQVEKIGWGAGTKILKIPNLLKVTCGYEITETDGYTEQDEIMVLECNLDDCTGEMLGAAMNILMENGARDVYYTPVYMKKNRPAWCLTVLAKPEDADRMEELMFLHTTTIGIRRHLDQRTILKREQKTVQTSYGELQVKRVKLNNGYRDYPEYESARKLAVEAGKPLWEILKNDGESGELI